MDEAASHPRTLVTHQWTSRGYHLFTFYESSKQAMDQWFELAKSLIASMQGQPILRQIYDLRKSGLLPMAYSIDKGKELMTLYPNPIPFRLAVVLGTGGFFGSLIQNFMNMLGAREGNQIRIFNTSQFDEAEHWVMEESDEA